MAITNIAQSYFELVKANMKNPEKGRPLTQVPTHLRTEVKALLDAYVAEQAAQQ